MTDEPDEGNEERRRLTRGGLLARNSLLTMAGQGSIIAVQIVSVPLLINQLGTARFGVLSLAWVVIGYAGFFDLGLGRALTKLTAERLGLDAVQEIPRLFWTALTMLGLLGLVSGALVAALAPVLVGSILNIPEALGRESLITFYLLAASLPFLMLSASLRGSLEARQRFDLTNAVAVPLSFLSYFGPVILSLISATLPVAVSALVASRVLACVVLLVLCLRVDPTLRSDRRFSRPLASALVRFGGWVTASTLLGSLLGSLDRFIVGVLVSARGVAYYATPFEAVKQLRVLSMSFSTVLFPAFATTVGTDASRAERLFRRGSRGVLLVMFPVSFGCVLFAPELLNIWVGEEFERNSSGVMQWMGVGILVNGIASVAHGMLQSTRPDLIFKLHLAELPFYVLAFWVFIEAFGVVGAAVAWTVRATVDGALLYAILQRLRMINLDSALAVALPVLFALVVFGLAAQLDSFAVKALFFVVTTAALGLFAWFRMLDRSDRDLLRSRLSLLLRRRAPAS